MELNQEPKYKDVLKYDFTFSNGYRIPITIDTEIGDEIKELEDRFVLHLVEKPGLVDPSEKFPAEVATVFKSHLLTVVVQQAKQRVRTPEEQFDFQETVKSLIQGPKVLQ